MEKISGSFRDPSATVFTIGERIIRGINKSGEEKFRLLTESKILEKSIEKNFLIDTKKILLKKAKIIKINNIENSLRKIYEYEKIS